jgi:hypothetical protein
MVGIFPFALLLALMAGAALAWAGLNVFKGFKSKQPMGWIQILLLMAPLLVIDGLVCFYIMISAALGHSEHLKDLVPVKCAIASLVILALPSLVLIFYKPKIHGKNQEKP